MIIFLLARSFCICVLCRLGWLGELSQWRGGNLKGKRKVNKFEVKYYGCTKALECLAKTIYSNIKGALNFNYIFWNLASFESSNEYLHIREYFFMFMMLKGIEGYWKLSKLVKLYFIVRNVQNVESFQKLILSFSLKMSKILKYSGSFHI